MFWRPVLGPHCNDGELLQGLNYLCNNGLIIGVRKSEKNAKNFRPRGAQHPRNLDPPLPSCYLPAEGFVFWHLAFFAHLT